VCIIVNINPIICKDCKMTGSKIFAGARLRRIRNRLQHSQAAFADSLGISPSYLNLIERDQRPLTAQVLLRLNTHHGVDIAELSASQEHSQSLGLLQEVISDPLLAGEIPVMTELNEAAQVAPNLVGATVKLYGAYREVLKRLGDLSQEITVKGAAPAELPFESVQRWMQESGPLFPTLEALAEEIWFELSPKDDVMAGLKARLRAHSGIDVRIIPVDIMGADRARYDRHSQRLLISEKLDAQERLFEAVWLLASLEGRVAIDEIVAAQFSKNAEAKRLARQGLVGALAVAILCPAAKFIAAAQDLKFDLAALSSRFSVSSKIVMQRLAGLSMREDSTMAIGFLCVDATGAIMDRTGKLGFFLPKSGALCGQLPIFDQHGAIKIACMKTADGQSLVVIAIREKHLMGAIFISPEDAAKMIYGPLAAAQTPRPLGPTCRLCNIKNCNLRREPPATRPAALNEFVRGPSDFEPM
jgi:XRE family transcriptional regulator, fatty acid utilization regulator